MPFPTTASAGQTYTTPAGKTFVYTSEGAWRAQVASGGGNPSGLTDNGDGTFTHNDGAGNTTTFDIPGQVVSKITAPEGANVIERAWDGVASATTAELGALTGSEEVLVEISGNTLRRVSINDLPQPARPPASYANNQSFFHTGGDQTFDFSSIAFTETDADNRWIRITAVGAGGGGNGVGSQRSEGGAGGYAQAVFKASDAPISGFGSARVVVGGAGVNATGANAPGGYGFGGNARAVRVSTDGGSSGGGLSGIFLQSSPVAATDAGNALIVAGGGGGSSIENTGSTGIGPDGGNGGDLALSGGQPTMAGANGVAQAAGGGGGGYEGGDEGQNRSGIGVITVQTAGEGGSSFAHAGAHSSSFAATPDGGSGVSTPQAEASPAWSSPLSRGGHANNAADNGSPIGGHGFVFIEWN